MSQIKLSLSEIYKCCDNDAKMKNGVESLIKALQSGVFVSYGFMVRYFACY